MAASSTSEVLSPIESVLTLEHQPMLKSTAASRGLHGHTNQFTKQESPDANSENASQLRKKSGTITPRKRIESLTQQLGVYSSRPSMANQDTPSAPVSFLNSPHSAERLAEERLRKAGLHIQFAKDEEENQNIKDEEQAGCMTLQERVDQVGASDAESRVIVESIRDVQVEVVDKSGKGNQYFVLGLNGSGEPPRQEQVHSRKKQRNSCAFKTRFSDYTKNVLEHAYEFNAEGSVGRKHLEPGIVKKLSDKCGISHEQVKQWVRNKNKKVRRRSHLLEAELDLRGDNDNMEVGYQFGRTREEGLRPSFTLNL